MTILVSLCSEIMIKTFGIGKVFLFYGICSLLSLGYLYLFMVESKGQSRSELVEKLRGEPSVRRVEEERVGLHETLEH